ncbi:MAG: phosphoribosylformylglycinamidine synthase, partial [Nitrospinae bacterium]|nr:phosphoribosylformylglycinamidine synthase [Nitrospinota bacterium]
MIQNKLLHLYRTPALSSYKRNILLKTVRERINPDIEAIETEFCFNIDVSEPITNEELNTLRWLLSETFEPENFSDKSFLTQNPPSPPFEKGGREGFIVEVGPRMNFTTAWSTNAVSVCHACGLTKIKRIERSRRYLIRSQKSEVRSQNLSEFINLVHDRMTECQYPESLETFESGIKPEQVYTIPLVEEGKSALINISRKMGLGFDDWDIDYYYNLFVKELKRNPTNVECFDLSQSNSEHSRHWFFRGRLIIDGKEIPESLMQIVKEPYKRNPNNSVIAFKDNSSAIKGYKIRTILPSPAALTPTLSQRERERGARGEGGMEAGASRFREKEVTYNIIFTAETHNFPSGVAPFPGAETGTGGRIRDVHATGRGGLVVAGTAAYCVGNLQIPDYPLPWEDESFVYPKNLASPLQIEIEASNGAS